jgi:hypothetical protein
MTTNLANPPTRLHPWLPALHYLWKIPLCGLLFFLGFIPGNWLAAALGLPAPALPAGAEATTVAQYTLLASLLLALALAFLSTGLAVPYLPRWLILFAFAWVGYGVNTYLEAAIFSTMASASFYTVVLYLPAASLCGAAVAALFPPATTGNGFSASLRVYFAQRPAKEWAWRLPLAYLAFPIAYLFFGTLLSPIVISYYQQGSNELALPGWEQILPTLALRSLLFLLICLPIVGLWQLSMKRLFVTLGLALFIVVGGLGMLEAYWLPAVLRMTHSLEILADELVYALALTLLLSRPQLTPNPPIIREQPGSPTQLAAK